MTRHGTLAYYLAAWIIGCPVVAFFYWLIGAVEARFASSSALFEICFFALMIGAADSLLFAFLLRRLMHWARVGSVAAWTLAGAALALALIFVFAQAWYRLHDSSQGIISLATTFLFAGPGAIWNAGWWQVPVEGAGIGAVLGLIDRAFNRAATEAAPTPSGESHAARAGQSPA
jgi:hypothetical protein